MSKSIQLKNSNNEKMYPHPYYPVGSIYLSVNNTNPSQWFGGTWEQIAKGRTLVGVDTLQTEFNTVKKTGGSKYTERHTHDSTVLTRANGNANANTWGELQRANANVGNSESKTNTYSSNGYFGSGNSGNLQPYFTCYIWCRTA